MSLSVYHRKSMWITYIMHSRGCLFISTNIYPALGIFLTRLPQWYHRSVPWHRLIKNSHLNTLTL